jgi:hypothetical protein
MDAIVIHGGHFLFDFFVNFISCVVSLTLIKYHFSNHHVQSNISPILSAFNQLVKFL